MSKRENGLGSVIQLEPGKYQCVMQSRYLNPDTNKPKRIKRTGKTENEAVKKCKAALMLWEKKIKDNNKDGELNNKLTFGKCMELFIDTEIKPHVTASTYKTYIDHLRNGFYPYNISNTIIKLLTSKKIKEYYDQLINEKGFNCTIVTRQLCSRCCTWLFNKSIIEDDYCKKITIKNTKKDEYNRFEDSQIENEKEIYSNEDIVKFYNAYKADMSEYCPAIIIMLETMMRMQELLVLTLDDIDLENNTITIRSALGSRFIDNDKNNKTESYIKVPKNGKTRTIYMSPLAKEAIEKLIDKLKTKQINNPLNLLFPSYYKQGEIRNVISFENQFKELCKKLNIDRNVKTKILPSGEKRTKGLCVHALRHTAITMANTAQNGNVINTALMAGHTAINTENVYTHSNIEALKQIETPGKAVLGIREGDNENTIDNVIETGTDEKDKENELYQMYLKLKDHFNE